MTDPGTLHALAERIADDEDFAMRVGEDAQTTLEAEGLDDETVTAVLQAADVDVVGFALPHDAVAQLVDRIRGALTEIAER